MHQIHLMSYFRCPKPESLGVGQDNYTFICSLPSLCSTFWSFIIGYDVIAHFLNHPVHRAHMRGILSMTSLIHSINPWPNNLGLLELVDVWQYFYQNLKRYQDLSSYNIYWIDMLKSIFIGTKVYTSYMIYSDNSISLQV